MISVVCCAWSRLRVSAGRSAGGGLGPARHGSPVRSVLAALAAAAFAAVVAAGCSTATPPLYSPAGIETAPAVAPAAAGVSPGASAPGSKTMPAAPGSRTMPSGLPSDPCVVLRLARPGQIKHVADAAVSYQAMVNTGSDNNG